MNKRKKWLTHQELKKESLKDPKFRREYEKLEPEFQVARAIIEARIKKKITQEELARKAGTHQAVISRLETMSHKPSISLVQKVAEALGLKLKIQLSPP